MRTRTPGVPATNPQRRRSTYMEPEPTPAARVGRGRPPGGRACRASAADGYGAGSRRTATTRRVSPEAAFAGPDAGRRPGLRRLPLLEPESSQEQVELQV